MYSPGRDWCSSALCARGYLSFPKTLTVKLAQTQSEISPGLTTVICHNFGCYALTFSKMTCGFIPRVICLSADLVILVSYRHRYSYAFFSLMHILRLPLHVSYLSKSSALLRAVGKMWTELLGLVSQRTSDNLVFEVLVFRLPFSVRPEHVPAVSMSLFCLSADAS